jgi:hypothetical protein
MARKTFYVDEYCGFDLNWTLGNKFYMMLANDLTEAKRIATCNMYDFENTIIISDSKKRTLGFKINGSWRKG